MPKSLTKAFGGDMTQLGKMTETWLQKLLLITCHFRLKQLEFLTEFHAIRKVLTSQRRWLHLNELARHACSQKSCVALQHFQHLDLETFPASLPLESSSLKHSRNLFGALSEPIQVEAKTARIGSIQTAGVSLAVTSA